METVKFCLNFSIIILKGFKAILNLLRKLIKKKLYKLLIQMINKAIHNTQSKK